MEWSNSNSIKLINEYKKYECLWNPCHDGYKSKTKKLDAWMEIAQTMGGEVNEMKKKMESLLSSFRRERQKQEASKRTGSGTEDIYTSPWFAFDDMLFLLDKFTPKATINTEVRKQFFKFNFSKPKHFKYLNTKL